MRLAAILAAFLAATPVCAKTIHSDGGGNAVQYLFKAEALRRNGEEVRIMGTCASACTIYLSANYCVGPRARLVFHSASNTRHVGRANALLMGSYPAGVRAWIRAHGGLTDRLLVLKGTELARVARACR